MLCELLEETVTMNYEQAMEYIHGTLKFGSILGLETISRLMDFMGNPQDKLKFIHVAGTNGKGSTAAFISNILIDAGYKTGVFTSPYIQRFNERIKINNKDIENNELTEIIGYVKEKIDLMVSLGFPHPTEFEIITAVAFEYFYRHNCELVVLEVGLGGRFDSTNVIKTPEVAVITTISLDHTDRLGSTISEIAFQKAGIIKQNGEVVVYPQLPEAEMVFKAVCKEMNSKLHIVNVETIKPKEFCLEGQQFEYKNYKNLETKLLGDHQLKNAAVAIDTCELLINKDYKIDYTNIRNGILKAIWPGRLEIVSKNPMVLIDGAHNLEGGQSLNFALEKYFAHLEKIFVVGFLGDKDYHQIMRILAQKAKLIITVTPDNPRALPSGEMAEELKKFSNSVIDGITLEKGMEIALSNSTPNTVVCAFGSLYMIGKVRDYFDI